jgi:hypothetical protein
MELYATARIVRGRIKVRDWNRILDQIATMRDGEVNIRITRAYATRSPEANAWYWSQVVGLVAKHTGYTPDEIHQIYKAKFLPKALAFTDGNGEIVGEFVLGGSTAKLNIPEFYDYCERIREWAADELDVVIPDPDPNWRHHERERVAVEAGA